MTTVLLVDDDDQVRDICYWILTKEGGHNVLRAGNGQDAIEVARQYTGLIELLLSDISMPGECDGLQLAQKLTADRPEVKVLLMSGLTPSGFVLEPGWFFIAKPFSPAALVVAAKHAIEDKSPAAVRYQPARARAATSPAVLPAARPMAPVGDTVAKGTTRPRARRQTPRRA